MKSRSLRSSITSTSFHCSIPVRPTVSCSTSSPMSRARRCATGSPAKLTAARRCPEDHTGSRGRVELRTQPRCDPPRHQAGERVAVSRRSSARSTLRRERAVSAGYALASNYRPHRDETRSDQRGGQISVMESGNSPPILANSSSLSRKSKAPMKPSTCSALLAPTMAPVTAG